jgi:hypothetical protein
MAPLTDALTRKLTIETKENVIETIFESRSNITRHALSDRYFKYYEQELEMVQFGGITQMGPVTPLAVKTHTDILLVIREIQTNGLLAKCKFGTNFECISQRPRTLN